MPDLGPLPSMSPGIEYLGDRLIAKLSAADSSRTTSTTMAPPKTPAARSFQSPSVMRKPGKGFATVGSTPKLNTSTSIPNIPAVPSTPKPPSTL